VDSAERDALLVTAARRVYLRYAVEIVEAHNFCPWAGRARREGQTREEVLFVTGYGPDAIASVLSAVRAMEARDEVEIGLLLFPRLRISRLMFESFVSDVRLADDALATPARPLFMMAAFHPDAPARVDSEMHTTRFVRRTPDPTIQLVRVRALAAVGADDSAQIAPASTAPMHARVAVANQATIARVGIDAIEQIARSIKRDRDESYARLGET
jgi:hypothetical protein